MIQSVLKKITPIFVVVAALSLTGTAAQSTDCACDMSPPGIDIKIRNKVHVDVNVNVNANVNAAAHFTRFSPVRTIIAGGGGGSFVPAPQNTSSIGSLSVVLGGEAVTRPVSLICVDGKGNTQAAWLNSADIDIDADYVGEIAQCTYSDMLAAKIGKITGQGEYDFTSATTIECSEGESLHIGNGGRLTCAAVTGFEPVKFTDGGQAIVRLHGETREQVVQTSGNLVFTGGVGY